MTDPVAGRSSLRQVGDRLRGMLWKTPMTLDMREGRCQAGYTGSNGSVARARGGDVVDRGTLQRLVSIGDLQSLLEFSQVLKDTDHFDAALRIKIERLIARKALDDDNFFDPARFISSDLSSIMYGLTPVIFMGTNEWAIKRTLSFEELDQKTNYYVHRIQCLSERVSGRLCFIVVPEKDIVMDKIAKRSAETENMDRALIKLSERCSDLG